jgi:hypothetical protein
VARTTDTTLAELLALPVLMAGLSLLMWFSLPTLPEALDALGSRFDERRETLKRLAPRAADLLPARSSRCATAVDPPPRFVDQEQETDATTNMEILGSPRLRELGIDIAIPDDLNLNLSGDLSTLMLWRMSPFINSRRMTRKRIARELERPLSYPYVLFYGDEMTEPLSRQADGRPRGAVRVSGVLFDLTNDRQLCELTFEERITPQFRDETDFARLAHSQLWSQARERLLSELAAIARGS